ncbi:hypothetical protein OH77DRAFT_967310 [Trametes cingulata]|nr:hypothetical protein OH77DRAFT_967310 [Trametes cingulata]
MPSRSGRSAQKRESKRTGNPYPASRPLANSAHANCKSSDSPSPDSSPSISGSSTKKLKNGERPVRRDLGMPSREEYGAVEADYLDALDQRKKGKALISQEMFDNIWLVLHRPTDHSIETPQFRWWVRKMFRLEARGGGPVLPQDLEYVDKAESSMVVIHDGKRVAVKEHIYDILCFCHARVDHAGRDKTAAEIRKRYTWIPKELIAGFVKNCPTCICKRTGKYDEQRLIKVENGEMSEIGMRLAEEYARDDSGDVIEGTGGDSGTTAYTRLPSLPLLDASMGPALVSSLAHPPATEAPGTGILLNLMPALVPWYMSSSGPLGLGSGSGGSSTGPPSGNPPTLLPSWNISPFDVSYQRAPFDEHVRLPSIHTCGRAYQQSGHCAKVTLPPLAQLLADDHSNAMGHMTFRQPLETLAGNAFSHPYLPHMFGGQNPHPGLQGHAPYVPQIDPALLQDASDVHVLAHAAQAEAMHMRGTAPIDEHREVE